MELEATNHFGLTVKCREEFKDWWDEDPDELRIAWAAGAEAVVHAIADDDGGSVSYPTLCVDEGEPVEVSFVCFDEGLILSTGLAFLIGDWIHDAWEDGMLFGDDADDEERAKAERIADELEAGAKLIRKALRGEAVEADFALVHKTQRD